MIENCAINTLSLPTTVVSYSMMQSFSSITHSINTKTVPNKISQILISTSDDAKYCAIVVLTKTRKKTMKFVDN